MIVFDMDGVIVDVSGSYRETVRQTARLFFSGAVSSERLPDPLFSLTDLARVKQSGGLNNDWDLTFMIINLLFTQVQDVPDTKALDPWSRFREAMGRCDVAPLAEFLTSEKLPVTTLMKQVGKVENEFVATLYAGDVGSGNVIKQMFQEIYLGKELFESTYGIPTRVFHDKGYINREKLLIEKDLLESLSENNTLAIATGRPRAEADYPLDVFGLRKFFSEILTLDDCLEAEREIFQREKKKVSLSKPNPYMLDAIEASQKHHASKHFFIGDMPDDMVAASRSTAGFIGIGILKSSSDKDRLKRDLTAAGADHVIENFETLKEIIDMQSTRSEPTSPTHL